MAKLIVSIDQGKCIGASNCVHIAPAAFQLDDEHVAYVIDPASVPDDELIDAARSCPTDAIYLDTEEGEAIYP